MDSNKKIIFWLQISAAMVFAMAVIGAITRLTESGLSMVEWRPLIGTIPPLSQGEWVRVFELYQQTPEYIHKNAGMGLSEFKTIFFWEWFHRFWGRLIGIVYAIPFFWFLFTKQIPQGYTLKLFGMLLLGGSQGVVGWWMVKSGLIDRPDVSHFRLATHLGIAFVIFSLLVWLILDLKSKTQSIQTQTKTKTLPRNLPAGSYKIAGLLSLALLAVTIIWGAFVAGLDAGLAYNYFPHMGTGPDGLTMTPDAALSVAALINDHGWVQFSHRWIAILTGFVLLGFAWMMVSFRLGLMVLVQIGLGIGALLSQLWIPVAAAHQAGAFLLLMFLIMELHKIKREKQSLHTDSAAAVQA